MEKVDKDQELDFERITIFYSNFPTSLLGIIASVTFLTVAVYHLYSPAAAIIWAIVMFATYLPRVLVSFVFLRKLKRGEIVPGNVLPWERYSLVASIAPFVCYVSVIFFPYGENTQGALLFFSVHLVAMIAGGSLAHSTSTGVLTLFLHINMPLLIARCLWEGGHVVFALAFSLIVAYPLFIRLISRLNKTMIENISMRIDSKQQSYLDPLTNLWNRRRLYLFLDMLIPATKRSGVPFSIILLDIDKFKEYNDTNGHNAGDELLVTVSSILRDCAREQDLVARYGGEEFIVVLPSTNLQQAQVVAERIIEAIRNSTGVTISAGIEEYSSEMDMDKLVQRADQALYEAKQAGGDTLQLAV